MLQSRGFPDSDYPSGWFQIAWSAEIAPGGVKPLRYFGRDLVLYRGESGEARLFDAFCPHLGAHLGYGGRVEGEDIVCPFHGWRWDCQGCNVDIPYSERTNRSRRLRTWPLHEADGLLLMWYDRNGAEPTWFPPAIPEAATGGYFEPYEAGTHRVWTNVALHPQWVAENAVDPAHQQFIHGAAQPGKILFFDADGPIFRARQELVFGVGKPSTWLTPGGSVTAYLDEEVMGVGLGIARFTGTDDAAHVQSTIPVDEEHCDIRVTVFVPRDRSGDEDRPDGAAMKRLAFQFRQLENDL